MNGKEAKAEIYLGNHLNRFSYRLLEDQEGISKKSLYVRINRICQELIDSNELTRILQPQNYSGILLIDGKYVPVKKVNGKQPGLIPRSKKEEEKRSMG